LWGSAKVTEELFIVLIASFCYFSTLVPHNPFEMSANIYETMVYVNCKQCNTTR